jgi:hypothetical protein
MVNDNIAQPRLLGSLLLLEYWDCTPKHGLHAVPRAAKPDWSTLAFALLIAGFLLLLVSFNETLAYGIDGTKLAVAVIS